MKTTLNFLLLLLLTTVLTAQEPISLTNGNLRAQFAANGAAIPAGQGAFLELLTGDDAGSLMFEAGLLISALDEDQNIKNYSTRGSNARLGFIGSDATVEQPWRVTSEQILAHIADYEDNGVIDDPVPEIFAWPGRGNIFFEEYNGFPLPVNSSSIYAQFYDTDFDGIYEPADGDFPAFGVRGCNTWDDPSDVALPTEMIFFPYALAPNADGNTLPGGDEVDLQVSMTAFRYGCEQVQGTINNSLYLYYQTLYQPEDLSTMTDAYIGFFMDGDIGCPSDDYVGLFPDRNAVYFYNRDNEDTACFGVSGYGEHPPMVSIDLLRGPIDELGNEQNLDNLMPLTNAAITPGAPPATTDYSTALEARNYLSGHWKDGMSLLDEGFGYTSGEPVERAFPGDPATGTGWSEVGENNPAGDRRAIMSSGPFDYLPGGVNEFVLSIGYNYEPEVGYLEQVDRLRSRVDTLQSLFDNCFSLESTSESLGCNQILTSVNAPPDKHYEPLKVFPNPALDQVVIETPPHESGQLYVYSATGRLLLQKQTFSEQTTLDFSRRPAGVYLLRWEGASRTMVQKLIVAAR